MTTRRLEKRMCEHTSMTSHNQEAENVSGLTEHIRSTGHTIISHKVIDSAKTWFNLRIKEGYHVATKKPKLNQNDSYNISDCWTTF